MLLPPPLIGADGTYLSCKKHFLELMQCHEKDRLLSVQWLNISYLPKNPKSNTISALLTCISRITSDVYMYTSFHWCPHCRILPLKVEQRLTRTEGNTQPAIFCMQQSYWASPCLTSKLSGYLELFFWPCHSHPVWEARYLLNFT